MEVSSRMAKSLTGDVGTLKLPSNNLVCSWSLLQQLASQLQQLGGSTGSAGAGTCAPEWRSFFKKKRPRHFQRQHCACETPTTLQEESTISFIFSYQSAPLKDLSMTLQEIFFYFPHMKNKQANKKPRASPPLPPFSAKPIHQSALQKLSTVPADFSLPSVAIHSRM